LADHLVIRWQQQSNTTLGNVVGCSVGLTVGKSVGRIVGNSVGTSLGIELGDMLGFFHNPTDPSKQHIRQDSTATLVRRHRFDWSNLCTE